MTSEKETDTITFHIGKSFDEYDTQVQNDITAFQMLVNTITTAEERKKELWKKIHYNATIDRRNAFMMYADLVKQIEKDSTQHAVLGTHVSKYLERMSKANDQLIKLAEIIDSKVNAIEAGLTSNDSILDAIQDTANSKKPKK